MSSDETPQDSGQPQAMDSQELPTDASPITPVEPKKRPRLDLTAGAGRERKRGKSMFGILVGTLNKAKIEDKERNASEAAKKRQLIEQRLQNKLRKETDSVRRAEEAKKDKTTANRKEEDLQLKDSIYKLRRKRLPIVANFLLTSDTIPSDDSSPPPSSSPLTNPPRTHPPPLYYLPAILTPAQEAFLERRKKEVSEAAEKEWELFREERSAGIAEIHELRERVAEEDSRRKAERGSKDDMETDSAPPPGSEVDKLANNSAPTADQDVEMEVDEQQRDHSKDAAAEQDKKEEPTSMQADDDDAVEY